MAKVAKVRGCFRDGVTVYGEPGEEDWHIEELLDSRDGLERVSKMVNVQNERWSV